MPFPSFPRLFSTPSQSSYTERNISFLSLKQVYRYLTVGTRWRLTRRIPSLREIDKKTPYVISSVILSSQDEFNIIIEIDDAKWSFRRECRHGSRGQLLDENGTLLKNGILMNSVYLIIRFHLNRSTGYIKHFRVDKHFELFPGLFSIPRIGLLEISDSFHFKTCVLSFLRTKIDSLNVLITRYESLRDCHLSKMQCNDLTMDILLIPDHYFEFLPFRKLKVTDTFSSSTTFIQMCQLLRKREYEEGSFYKGICVYQEELIWESLQIQFEGKVEDKNCLILKTENSGYELVVDRWEKTSFPGHYRKYQVQKVVTGSKVWKEKKDKLAKIQSTSKECTCETVCSVLIIIIFSSLYLGFWVVVLCDAMKVSRSSHSATLPALTYPFP